MVGKWFGFEKEEVFEEGVSSFERGDFEGASKAFEACQADEPSDVRFQPYLTACYEAMAKQAMAEEEYLHAAALAQNAIILDPKRLDLHMIAATAFKAVEKLSLAKFHLQRALGFRGDQAVYH